MARAAGYDVAQHLFRRLSDSKKPFAVQGTKYLQRCILT